MTRRDRGRAFDPYLVRRARPGFPHAAVTSYEMKRGRGSIGTFGRSLTAALRRADRLVQPDSSERVETAASTPPVPAHRSGREERRAGCRFDCRAHRSSRHRMLSCLQQRCPTPIAPTCGNQAEHDVRVVKCRLDTTRHRNRRVEDRPKVRARNASFEPPCQDYGPSHHEESTSPSHRLLVDNVRRRPVPLRTDRRRHSNLTIGVDDGGEPSCSAAPRRSRARQRPRMRASTGSSRRRQTAALSLAPCA